MFAPYRLSSNRAPGSLRRKWQQHKPGRCHHVGLSGAQQVESLLWSLGVHQFGLLQLAAQFIGRGVISHGPNTNPGLVRIGNAVD